MSPSLINYKFLSNHRVCGDVTMSDPNPWVVSDESYDSPAATCTITGILIFLVWEHGKNIAELQLTS